MCVLIVLFKRRTRVLLFPYVSYAPGSHKFIKEGDLPPRLSVAFEIQCRVDSFALTCSRVGDVNNPLKIKPRTFLWLLTVRWEMDCTTSENANPTARYAKKDPSIFKDFRVLENLLRDETLYVPKCNYFEEIQVDIQPYMRKVVTTWMLEVRKSVFRFLSVLFDKLAIDTCWIMLGMRGANVRRPGASLGDQLHG